MYVGMNMTLISTRHQFCCCIRLRSRDVRGKPFIANLLCVEIAFLDRIAQYSQQATLASTDTPTISD